MAVASGASVEMLSQLTGLEVRSTERAIRVLADAGLLAAREFRHPQVRSAILDTLPCDEAARLHRAAAVLLHDEGAPDLAVAEHLLASGPVTEPWAVHVLIDASRQTLRADQVALALRCLKLAEKCSQNETERLVITAARAAAHWRIRPEATARMLSTLAGAVRERRLPTSHSLALVPGMLWHGMDDAAISALHTYEDASLAESDERAALATTILWMRGTYPGLAAQNRDLIERLGAKAVPDGIRDYPARDAHAALVAVLQGEQQETLGLVVERVLLRVTLDDSTFETLVAAIAALIYAGRLDMAAFWCDRLKREAAERCASTWHAMLNSLHALVVLRSGDLVAASRLAAEALSGMSPEGWGVGMGMPLATAIDAAVRMGDYRAAEKLLAEPVPEDLLQTRFGLHYVAARARYHLAQGHPHAALADFVSCGERMSSWGINCASVANWRVGAAQTWLQMNNRERAAQLAEEQLSVTDPGQAGARGAALRILAGTKPPWQRNELLGQALELLHASGDRYEEALTLAALGHMHEKLGNSAKARIFAHRAWRMAKDCGAEALCRSLFPPCEGPGRVAEPAECVSPALPSSLTEAERRVGSLAAQGHSNREISRKLFITVSTVEQHLTRVYRKLDVRQRRDLPDNLVFAEPDRCIA